jgi:GWxTD domain-containing protein
MRQRSFAPVLAGAISLGVAAPTVVGAQGALASRRDGAPLATYGDSLEALRALDGVVRSNQTDASVWHQRGVLAWRLSRAEQRTGFMKREANDSLLALADSSLRLATHYGANTPGYLVDLGRFKLTSNSASDRSHATKLFEKALKEARKRGDNAVIARASDELGMTWWRKYEDRADRNIYSYVMQNNVHDDRTFLHDPRSIAYFVDNLAVRAAAQDWSGQLEYLKAWDYFADALRADPANQGALRHTYMALADRKRWDELQHFARARLATDSLDAWAWLASGLAAHRLGDDAASARAFDAGLRILPPHERDRFDRLTRIFSPKDSASMTQLPDSEKVNVRKLYWIMADPLWMTSVNEHRLEFLSRVVYAELRFSVEEFGLHGADTDRGQIYVRYGPPPAIISFPADPLNRGEHRIRVLWWYSADEAFMFRQLPTYSVATLDADDMREFRRIRDTIPVVWRNAGDDRPIDSIDVQVVRFRAPADSTDIFVAARVPVARMTHGLDLARGALRLDFQAYNWRADTVFRKTRHEIVDLTRPDPDQLQTWHARMHAGTFLYRVEALQPDAMRGARGANRMEVVHDPGFAMSDLLVAGAVAPRPGDTGGRWSDFEITPNLGRVRRGSPFSLLWETYDLQPRSGNNEYNVAITLEREHRGGIGGFFAKIVGGVAGAVGLSHGGSDVVSLDFPRRVPARPVMVDYVTLDLGDAPAGRYKLTVTITDNATHRKVTRESAVTVVE